jgi:hypothetical protein
MISTALVLFDTAQYMTQGKRKKRTGYMIIQRLLIGMVWLLLARGIFIDLTVPIHGALLTINSKSKGVDGS